MTITAYITMRCTATPPPADKKRPYLARLSIDKSQLSGLDYEFGIAHKNRCKDKEQHTGSRDAFIYSLRAKTGEVFEARLAFIEAGAYLNKMAWFAIENDAVRGLANKAGAKDRLYDYRRDGVVPDKEPLYGYYDLHRLIRATAFVDPPPRARAQKKLKTKTKWTGSMAKKKKMTAEQIDASRDRLAKEVGRLVKKMRLKRGLSQSELSVKMYGYEARKSVSQIETGRSGITLWTLFWLSNALDCEAEDLVPGSMDDLIF